MGLGQMITDKALPYFKVFKFCGKYQNCKFMLLNYIENLQIIWQNIQNTRLYTQSLNQINLCILNNKFSLKVQQNTYKSIL